MIQINKINNIRFNIIDFIPLLLVVIYGAIFINSPISEDTGYYGFLAKSINNGSILHVDIPVATHGIFIFELAGLFNTFGSSIIVLRLFYLVHLAILIYFLTLILNKLTTRLIAVLVSSYALILLCLPAITLDIGRSPHLISLAYVITGAYLIFFSNYKNKIFYAGILLGIAATNRESYGLYFLPFIYISYLKGGIKKFTLGYIFVMALFLIFLINTTDVSRYLSDILVSGTKFRSGSNGHFFSGEKIASNILEFKDGYSKYYSTYFIIAIIGYLIHSKNKIKNYVCYFILPCEIFIEINVNKTTSYSIQPIIVFSTIPAINFINWYIKYFSLFSKKLNALELNSKLLLTMIPFIFIFSNLRNIYFEYSHYNRVVKSFISGGYKDSDPYRLLLVLNEIPHRTIGAHSQYPLLFLSNVAYDVKYPYIQDTSAAENMFRKDIWENTLKYFELTPPDIMVDKTTNSYLSKKTPMGSIWASKFIEIANFPPGIDSEYIVPYADRIALSNSMVKKMKLVKNITINKDYYEHFNSSKKMLYAKILDNKECKYMLVNGMSAVSSNENTRSSSYIYSMILPNTALSIKSRGENCPKNYIMGLYSF